MKDELKIYIKLNLEKDKSKSYRFKFGSFKNIFSTECFNEDEEEFTYEKKTSSINQYLKDNEKYSDFQTMLFKLIDERNLKDSDVYNKVNIDRRLFSKIRSDKNYHPSKETLILLGFSLELSELEIVELLDSASYSLPKNNYFDLIIRFCFINKIYNINNVNELLYDYDCKLLNV
ncbi:MAG: hypothetical protein ACI4P7_07140 [Bacilli bacterium]